MEERRIWLHYDLETFGDYGGLYEWLDDHDAQECGDSLATLDYTYEENLVNELTNELEDKVDFKCGDRIYIVFKFGENDVQGRFIVGRRTLPRWLGYGKVAAEETPIDVG